MGSLKKKLTKTLRKITPKEIAPILPIASMFIPGMQGLSPLLKFALPQLLTAAGSARTSGKISGLNQALAGIGSLAVINASNQALQTAASSSPATLGGPGALKPTSMGTGLTATQFQFTATNDPSSIPNSGNVNSSVLKLKLLLLSIALTVKSTL